MPLPLNRVLVVDDDPALRQFLCQELSAAGYVCIDAASASQAINYIRQERFDLVLLDWTLSDFSGLDVCRHMRDQHIATPVLMLTAHDELHERVKALDVGADDYLTKPFEIEELLARVRVQLRRSASSLVEYAKPLQYGDLELDPASRSVRRGETSLSLTAREFDLLHLLISRPGQVFKRRQILDDVWGVSWVGDDNILDVYIRALRRKVEVPGEPSMIQTVRGVGFMLKFCESKAAKA